MEIGTRFLKRRKGFTLVETLLALALLLLLLQITLPHLKEVPAGWQLEIAAKEVATLIRQTQILAIKENKALNIRCLESDGEQRIVRYEGITPRTPSYYLPNGIRVSNRSSFNITFHPRGTPSVGVTIKMKNGLDKVKLVVISPVTGRVVVRNE